MPKRFVSIWFRYLTTDRIVRSQPQLKHIPFVLATPERGRMMVKAANPIAVSKGIHTGMVVADCRAILPGLQVLDNPPGLAERLLNAMGEWCIRYTPIVATDLPDGLLLDASGCSHLWGGEQAYLDDIVKRLNGYGYNVSAAIADTAGAAWAMARYGQTTIIEPGKQATALLSLPSAALRLEPAITERLDKLGLYHIRSFMNMPRRALRRRFGTTLLMRLDQALGQEMEIITPIQPIEPYQERLPCMEPICTAKGIEIALEQLLQQLCTRLEKEEKGLRTCSFKCYRIDGDQEEVQIGTNRPSRNTRHLFKLFELHIPAIEPGLGIELFVMEATIVEELPARQDAIWHNTQTCDIAVAELLDRVAGKVGMQAIHRYLPAEHTWPERSFQAAASLAEQPATEWRTEIPRPIHLLPQPEPIEVTVAIPDYPPMLFRYQDQLHRVVRADGPERIEQEWWIEQGLYRDYYCVEDEEGIRYWLFRLGHYDSEEPKWFLHGFFA